MKENAKVIKTILDNPWGLISKQQVDRLRGFRQTITMEEFMDSFMELRKFFPIYQKKLMALSTIILDTRMESVSHFEMAMK